MEQFYEGHHVWLRSRMHGTYLHVDEDGHGVSLTSRRACMRAAWVARRYHGDDHHVLLLNAAYGRYLAATGASAPLGCSGFHVVGVEQRYYDELEEETTRWQAINFGSHILLQHPTGDRYRYLRANGGHYRPWNVNVVSVDNFDDDDFENISTMMQWVVEPIPSRLLPYLT